jgi:hypothetical protein
VHYLPDACGYGAEQLLKIQIRNDLVGQVENQLKAVLRLLRKVEVGGGVNRECELISYKTEELEIVFGVGVCTSASNFQHSQPTVTASQGQRAGGADAEFGEELTMLRKLSFA